MAYALLPLKRYGTVPTDDTVIGLTLSLLLDRLCFVVESNVPGDMMEFQPSLPLTVHPDCVEFVRIIEELLLLGQ